MYLHQLMKKEIKKENRSYLYLAKKDIWQILDLKTWSLWNKKIHKVKAKSIWFKSKT